MSTWIQDLRVRNPKLADAYAIVGNQSREDLKCMVKALKMFEALNTPEENQRLAAAQFILRSKS